MEEVTKVLKQFEIPYDEHFSTTVRVRGSEYVRTAPRAGIESDRCRTAAP